jgi:hypothetical protein
MLFLPIPGITFQGRGTVQPVVGHQIGSGLLLFQSIVDRHVIGKGSRHACGLPPPPSAKRAQPRRTRRIIVAVAFSKIACASSSVAARAARRAAAATVSPFSYAVTTLGST